MVAPWCKGRIMPATESIAARTCLPRNDDNDSSRNEASTAIKAVLFDLGDTIIHFATWKARPYLVAGTRPAHQRLIEMGFNPPPYHKYARRLGATLLRSILWSRITRREAQLLIAFHKCHARMGIDLTQEQMRELAAFSIAPVCELISVDPEARPVLSELRKRGLKLGIVSNTVFPAFAIDNFLHEEGLLEFFPTRIYSSDVRYMKPQPGIFKAALDELRADANSTLYVGDRLEKDVRGAKRVGMPSVLLLHRRRRRLRPKPDYVIRALAELLEILPV